MILRNVEKPATGKWICTHPFEWLEVHRGGVLFLCCPAWLKRSIGILGEVPLEQLWNGVLAREIRQTVTNGSFHRCNPRRCPRLRARKAPVQRLTQLPEGPVRQVVQAGQVRLPYGPRHLNLCFDDHCNLICPSCREATPSRTAKEKGAVHRLAEAVEWELAPQARSLSLSGHGDPFAAPAYRWLLERVDGQRWPRLERIHLHTNGIGWTESAWERWSHLHGLVRSAEVSIDAATAETYHRNRRGSWETLQWNLNFIAGLPLSLKISMVVQQNNYREMPAFVEMGQALGAEIYFSQLVNWGTFSRGEFVSRAVHRPDHPEHEAFLDRVKAVQGREGVDLGNLLERATALDAS